MIAENDMRSYRIYMYTNKVNNKIYIGQTRNTLEFRARNGHNYHGSRYFDHAIKKYGWENFVPVILEDGLNHDEACEREKYYIKLYDSQNPDIGYNISEGGESTTDSAETRALISRNAKERYKDPTKNPMYGRHHTDEAKRKIGEKSRLRCGPLNPNYRRVKSQEEVQRMSAITKRLIASDPDKWAAHYRRLGDIALGNKYRAKRVRRIEDGKEWESAADAANEIGVCKASICDQLKGRSHTCHGYHFEYVE